MSDKKTTIEDLKNLVKNFTQERDWEKFLDPKTISIYMSLEAAELMEIFVWVDNQQSKQKLFEKQEEIKHELVDILYWVFQMSWIYKIDLADSLKEKLELNAKKYPIEKSKGVAKKYTEL